MLPVAVLKNQVLKIGEDKNCVTVVFHKTLRVPQTSQEHLLPSSLGRFPIENVDDYRDRVPKKWLEEGGVFIPMYQKEALWMEFKTDLSLDVLKPKALLVATGGINSISGKPLALKLTRDPQDYLVLPEQKWFDGVNSGGTSVKQFVAMPVGSGTSVEKQITGRETSGGIQLALFESLRPLTFDTSAWDRERKINRTDVKINIRHRKGKPVRKSTSCYGGSDGGWGNQGTYVPYSASFNEEGDLVEECEEIVEECQQIPAKSPPHQENQCYRGEALSNAKKIMSKFEFMGPPQKTVKEMSISVGGTISQKIDKDMYDFDIWDKTPAATIFVHIVSPEAYYQITGKKAPDSRITQKMYKEKNYPWFDYYDENQAIEKSNVLSKLKTVNELDESRDIEMDQPNKVVLKHVNNELMT